MAGMSEASARNISGCGVGNDGLPIASVVGSTMGPTHQKARKPMTDLVSIIIALIGLAIILAFYRRRWFR